MINLNSLTGKSFRPTVLAAILSASTLLAGCGSEEATSVVEQVVRPVLVEEVSNIETADLSFNGVIQSASRAELSFKTNGRLVELLVQEGDYVEAGAVIAKLDSADAQIALTSARVERDNARAEYQRAKKLYESRQSISKSQFEELTLRFDLAQNRFEEASRRLDDTTLTAPFSGVVSRSYVENHVLVQSNEVIVALHDLENLEAVIHVPESLMTRNSEANTVLADSGVAPFETYKLNLKKFETEPDPVSGTYAVTFSVETTPESRLLPGMSVHVYSDEVQSELKSIQIPLTAVNPDNMGNQYVWVVGDNNQLVKRNVETGSLNGDRIHIEANLQLGERVVVSGTQSLTEGLEVRPELTEVY